VATVSSSASSRSWLTTHHRGSASTFHALEPTGEQRQAWWLDVDRAALVLGSAQLDAVADHDACARAGVEIVRRRSGGGAVLLLPGECVWLDVVVPRDDPLWDDDIGESMWWLGRLWADALEGVGCGDVAVHRGPLQHTPWSRLVCFDGLGAGEVTVGGRKAVGVSQRRTRHWARLQSSLNLVSAHDDRRAGGVQQTLVPLLSPPRPTTDQLRPVAAVDASIEAVQAAVNAALATR
jgi:hypothetical protein